MNNVDKQYQDLLQNILDYGNMKESRAGETKGIFGTQMRFNLKEGFPLLTTKKMFIKGIIHELIWIISGSTNIKYLVDNDVNIWNDDAYRYYLEKVNKNNSHTLEAYEAKNGKYTPKNDNKENTLWFMWCEPISKKEFIEVIKNSDSEPPLAINNNGGFRYGDLNKVYGHQWRHWDVDVDYGSYIDQLQEVINKLKTNPDDRRMIISAWNVSDIPSMALPPCHMMCQFYTRELSRDERWELLLSNTKSKLKKDLEANIISEREYCDGMDSVGIPYQFAMGLTSLNPQGYVESYKDDFMLDEGNIPKRELSCQFQMRSLDFFLGVPFNIASYALFTHMIAQVTNMSVGDLVLNGGDTHIYLNHMDAVQEQLSRDPYKYELPKLWLNPKIKNIDDFTFDDIKLENYESYPQIKAPLSVGL